MNKKESNETIALAAFLIGMFCYPVAYGTIESSYKYGYGQGKAEWSDCTDFDADCSDGLSDCHSPVTTYAKNSTSGYYDI